MPPAEDLYQDFYAAGQKRTVGRRFLRVKADDRPEVTIARMIHTLEHPTVTGVTKYRGGKDPDNTGISYWSRFEIDGKERVFHVVTNAEADLIQTAHFNRDALEALQKNKPEWFDRHCENVPTWH